ncbi:MAG: STAS-like domain-containing protein [Phycisphaerales bacterium]|nr:STAS-like domain-containing protein [Phycisphaerales bacterium]MCI0676508.1 STAS-like domain-containing protein [Phycisphaerales bacterium]
MLEAALRQAIAAGPEKDVVIDFEGVSGVAPSFVDELVTSFQTIAAVERHGRSSVLIVAHPPTRLSLKFEAIARGHGMSVRSLDDGSWVLRATG